MPANTAIPPGRAILGGSFNPPHIGHLRLAIEVCETLGEHISGLDMMPCAIPPHKSQTGMLPFDLRAALLEACLTDLPRIRCNRLEGTRKGPSYTWDTLLTCRNAVPDAPLYFILGSPDFARLHTWHNGLELPELCQLLVAPRDGQTCEDFLAAASAQWPQARQCAPVPFAVCSVALPHGGAAHFLPVPWLEISASRIRQRWLANLNIDFLVPPAAVTLLHQEEQQVRHYWQAGNKS